eukprot:g12309.t1
MSDHEHNFDWDSNKEKIGSFDLDEDDSPEMYSLSIKETQDVMSIVGREIQLTKDYTTGNATFKQGSRGTVIEVPSRKDGKLKVKLDNDNEKTDE